MSEDAPQETSITSAEGIAKFLEKWLATILLQCVLYVGWTSFLSPAKRNTCNFLTVLLIATRLWLLLLTI